MKSECTAAHMLANTLCRYMIEDAADAWEQLRNVCRVRFVQGFTQLVQPAQCTTIVEVVCHKLWPNDCPG
jgi:hypothetical protein